MTPITSVMGGRTMAGAATGACTSAASVHAVIEPSIHGSGRFRRANSQPPTAPMSKAASKRPYGKTVGDSLRARDRNAASALDSMVLHRQSLDKLPCVFQRGL